MNWHETSALSMSIHHSHSVYNMEDGTMVQYKKTHKNIYVTVTVKINNQTIQKTKTVVVIEVVQ